MTICTHNTARRNGPSIEGWVWCTKCDVEVAFVNNEWHSCDCYEIMKKDKSRHFRDCVLREKYPTHEAEKTNMPGPIVMEFLAWLRAQELWGAQDADETICAEFFAQRIEAKREGVIGDRRCVHVERVGYDFDPRQCTRQAGHAGPHFPSPERERIVANRRCQEAVGNHQCSLVEGHAGIHVFESHGGALKNFVEELNLDVARERNALLEDRQRIDTTLAVHGQELRILDERTAFQSKCEANNVDAIQQLDKRLKSLTVSLSNLDGTLSTRIAQLDEATRREIMDAHSRLQKLEMATPTNLAGRLDTAEKAGILFNMWISELVNMLIHANSDSELKEVLRSFQRRMLEPAGKKVDVRFADAVKKEVSLEKVDRDRAFKLLTELEDDPRRVNKIEGLSAADVERVAEEFAAIRREAAIGEKVPEELSDVGLLKKAVEYMDGPGYDAKGSGYNDEPTTEAEILCDILKAVRDRAWMKKIQREIPFELDDLKMPPAPTPVEQRLWALGTPEAKKALDEIVPPKIVVLRPKIVVLCGSTRFGKAFADANLTETLKGNIVLTVGSMTHSDAHIKACIYCGLTPDAVVTDLCTAHLDAANSGNGHEFHPLDSKHHIGTKGKLDTLHFRKIEMADEVFVLNAMRCIICGNAQRKDFDNWGHGNDCRYFRHTSPFPNRMSGWEPYIGDSTKNEIRHALKLGKPIRYLNPNEPK